MWQIVFYGYPYLFRLDPNAAPLPDMVEKTPEEKESERKKEHEMETRKKSEFCKKEFDMLDEIHDLQRMVSMYPIGRDRLYRRYYFFSGLNGVFIEDHELHVPSDMLTTDNGTKVCLPNFFFGADVKFNDKSH